MTRYQVLSARVKTPVAYHDAAVLTDPSTALHLPPTTATTLLTNLLSSASAYIYSTIYIYLKKITYRNITESTAILLIPLQMVHCSVVTAGGSKQVPRQYSQGVPIWENRCLKETRNCNRY